jgi:hypothetical protein
VPTGGKTLEGQTTSSNSARNSFNHSGNSSGGVWGSWLPLWRRCLPCSCLRLWRWR